MTTTKEIRRAECAKQSARFFYYSELKRYERKKSFIGHQYFESGDFLEYPTPSEDDKFDIAILHDVIEHVPDKIAFLSHIRKFLKEDGILFVAFPAWQMPFGGHQQICRNKTWSKVPYFHLFPNPLYRFILNRLAGEEEAMVSELISIKKTKCSIERFEKVVKATGLSVCNRQLWLINPHYQQKFGLRPRKLCRGISYIPFFRNFYSTSCFYLLKLG